MTSRARQICPTHGCGATLRRWERLCDRCFALLPQDRRAAICEARARRDVLTLSKLTGAAAIWLAAHMPAAVAARRQGEEL